MDLTGWRRTLSVLLVVAATGCWVDSSRDDFPSSRETLRTVGRRLSANGSERELTAIATRGPELLARLERSEAPALARGTCGSGWTGRSWSTWRHRWSRPRSGWRTAASARRTSRWRIPTRAGSSIDGPSTAARSAWESMAWTALRRPTTSCSSGRSRAAGRADERSSRSSRWKASGIRGARSWPDPAWRGVRRQPAVRALPDELVGSVMLQPAHAATTRRCSRRDASGRRMWPPLRNRTRWR